MFPDESFATLRPGGIVPAPIVATGEALARRIFGISPPGFRAEEAHRIALRFA
jgi:hypothetical protein